MPKHSTPIYRRGKYWLAADIRSDGSARSPNFAIFWYDPVARRTRTRSAKTPALDAAIVALDRVYLADRGEASHYCPTCGRATPSAASYLLTDAIADYRLEVGDGRFSASSIRARCGHILDFLDATGRQTATCADAASLVGELRLWLAARPVEWRNKKGAITVTKQRAPATVEESIHQLAVVINYAHAQRRVEAAAGFRGLPRRAVSAPRTIRIGVDTLASMLAHAADPLHPRRRPLHAFLIASIATVARPDSVFDISVDPKRLQLRTPGLIDLNPYGRVQTDKRRPVLPVPPVLAAWLADVSADPNAKNWLCEVAGEPVASIDTSWKGMLRALGLPGGREMQPYLVRHSMATLLRDRGATAWDLQGQMGHRMPGTTELYAVSTLFVTAQAAIRSIVAELDGLVPGAMHRRRTGIGSNVVRFGSVAST